MKLTDLPLDIRRARTEALKYVGFKLKEKGCSKNVRRQVLLELDCKIAMEILELLNSGLIKRTPV